MRLSLIVLKSENPESLAGFYGRLGLSIAKEQHGNGPIHYAIQLHDAVLEIYPSSAPSKTTFGLSVQDVAAFRARWLSADGRIGKNTDLLLDPDGNVMFSSRPHLPKNG